MVSKRNVVVIQNRDKVVATQADKLGAGATMKPGVALEGLPAGKTPRGRYFKAH